MSDAAPHIRREASRKYHARNRERINKLKRARWHRDKKRDPEKLAAKRRTPQQKAGAALRSAVYYGKIKKPDRCSQCQTIGPVQGHHTDYNKPLEVTWLCADCHGLTRRKRDFLIAAAPELLEALKALLDIAPFATDAASAKIHADAQAAIAKAEGR